MTVNTSRFGSIEVSEDDVIQFTDGLLGFESLKRFFIIDPADETLILWLQSMDAPDVAFPILEPKIFKSDYKVRLSANELRALKVDSTNSRDTLVYCILTIPQDVSAMTANLKAPIVINAAVQTARQVVLQENEYSVKYSIYKDLLAMMASTPVKAAVSSGAQDEAGIAAMSLRDASTQVEVLAL